MYEKQKTDKSAHLPLQTAKGKAQSNSILLQMFFPQTNASGILQMRKEAEDQDAEDRVNKMLEGANLGVLASTIATKNLSAPLKTSLKYDDDSIEELKEQYTALHAPEIDRQINVDHLSMNWSLIPGDNKAIFIGLESEDAKPSPNPLEQAKLPMRRDFAYLADPSKILERIISSNSTDQSSNSNLSSESFIKASRSNEEKTEELRRVHAEYSKSNNSEIKTLSFNIQGFIGLLCNTGAYKKPASYESFKGETITLRIFRYNFDNEKKFECIAKVEINGDTITIDDFLAS